MCVSTSSCCNETSEIQVSKSKPQINDVKILLQQVISVVVLTYQNFGHETTTVKSCDVRLYQRKAAGTW